VPSGPALKKGSDGRRVELLRRRLAATGDLATAAPGSKLFDASVEQAVRRFQARHRLGADGIVGRNTLKALNVTVQGRIDQLRVNLERARWILHEVTATEEFVITDIAAFEVMFIKDGEIAWEARAQVGKEFRKTPTFKSDIKYLVFNPTWTIPPGILSKDVLPAVKRDPGYLAERNIRVLDRDGKEIDRESIDWSKYPGRGFPYILRQDPGPTNALGLVKFIFPNPHFVYLHDTPSKNLFERRQRTFSSGCIRVERPFELAELLLDDPGKWNRAAIDAVIESGEMRTVFLREPMPVLLLYWTVRIRDGLVVFKEDIYGRDEAVLEALNGEFKVRGRGVLGGGKL
jgi:murein L,D-transpeptidase YcbB/YkuD